MTQEKFRFHIQMLLPTLWFVGLATVVFALWYCLADPIALWRRAIVTGLILVAGGGTTAWLFRRALNLSRMATVVAVSSSIVPVLLVWPVIRTRNGEHLTTSYFRARQMASELESIASPGVQSYLDWHGKWNGSRAHYISWFPSISRRIDTAETTAVNRIAGDLAPLALTRPDDVLSQIEVLSNRVTPEQAAPALSHARSVAMLGKRIADVRRSNRILISMERYKEAATAAHELQQQLRDDVRELRVKEELNKLVDEHEFFVDLYRIVEVPQPAIEPANAVRPKDNSN